MCGLDVWLAPAEIWGFAGGLNVQLKHPLNVGAISGKGKAKVQFEKTFLEEGCRGRSEPFGSLLVRITGGRARGIPLLVGKSKDVRPATDRMREALFSSLGSRIDAARVLDLFAGSGAYGLEAWSRGAASVEFHERHKATVACLEANVDQVARSLGSPREGAIRVRCSDLFKVQPTGLFDLILADPPYADLSRAVPRIAEIARHTLAPNEASLLCLETPGGQVPRIAGFRCLKTIGKGREQPCMSLFIRTAPDAPADQPE